MRRVRQVEYGVGHCLTGALLGALPGRNFLGWKCAVGRNENMKKAKLAQLMSKKGRRSPELRLRSRCGGLSGGA